MSPAEPNAGAHPGAGAGSRFHKQAAAALHAIPHSQSTADPGNGLFRIGFICTGNICRSAYAQHGLTRLLSATPLSEHVVLSSAGVGPVVGAPVEAETAKLLLHDFGSCPDHSAQEAVPTYLQAQDLLLVMTRAHRQEILHHQPALLPRVFLVNEFTRIAEKVPPPRTDHEASVPQRLSALVAAASRLRAIGAPALDIPDPYGREPRVHLAVAGTLLAELESLRRHLLAAACQTNSAPLQK